MIIRKIKKRDVSSIYNLALRQFRGERWLTKSFLEDTIKTKGLYYGAFENKKLIGAILVKLDDRPKVWIHFFDVDKKFRRRVIGNKLFCKVEKELPKHHFLIIVDFEKTDIEGRKFYEEHGFKKKAKINDWFGKNRPGLIYAREIRRPKKN
jgi:ribosomal protein S18 acetylase RimI-like enzyme